MKQVTSSYSGLTGLTSLSEVVIAALWQYRNHSKNLIGFYCQTGTHKVFRTVTKRTALEERYK